MIGTPEERFWPKVSKRGPADCWPWTAGLYPEGYGLFWCNGSNISSHRFAYELLVGPIPDGLQIDHLCRNRACVNPAHLEVVTPGENVRRGIGPTAINARKTHCVHGHEFTPENTSTISTRPNARHCRACERGRRK